MPRPPTPPPHPPPTHRPCPPPPETHPPTAHPPSRRCRPPAEPTRHRPHPDPAAVAVRRRTQPRNRLHPRPHRHEPRPRVEHLAAAELVRELLGHEPALDHLVPRAVVEDPFVHPLRRDVGAARRVDHHKLARAHPPRLREEPQPRRLFQVPVEVAGEHALELAV